MEPDSSFDEFELNDDLSEIEEMETTDEQAIPSQLPLLKLRDEMVFPGTITPILVGRLESVGAVELAFRETNKYVLLVMQDNAEDEYPSINELHHVGVVAQIKQILPLPNDIMKVIVEGIKVAQWLPDEEDEDELKVNVLDYPIDGQEATHELYLKMESIRKLFYKYIREQNEGSEIVFKELLEKESPLELAYYIASFFTMTTEEKRFFLEVPSMAEKLDFLMLQTAKEIDLFKMKQDVSERVQEEIQKSQKRFFIHEQIKLLQEELDEQDFGDPDLHQLYTQVESLPMPEQARAKCLDELHRLKKMSQMSPEYSVSRNYVNWILSMPWGEISPDNLDIRNVEQKLAEDHFGLEKPKERILEHIAVLNLVESLKGQILCFVGPPGTGKTSLAKSIAQALGRKSIRIALGGVSDEGEIRGHRKTYIGSMPGRIIQAIKKAGTLNPVIILDEIDKLGSDHRGDPSSAILEVLDPEQNNTFNDHYLEIDFDLSQVMFITTANLAHHIQPALLDRMELISLPGYLEHDKLEIAKRHLIPKQRKAHGLSPSKLTFKDEAIYTIIRSYTNEAGVRNLEQQISAVCRKAAKQWVLKKAEGKRAGKITVSPKKVIEMLGVERYRERKNEAKTKIGTVQGLAWTSTGGSVLQIEVAVLPGKKNFLLTGQLGDVMKESAQAALTYLRSKAKEYQIEDDFFYTHELHIHIPEGAIKKDGPSAGITMSLAMLSAIKNIPVRQNVAMTGEINLRGEVLPIGGLNEKLLAAQRNRVEYVLIPKENERDLADIPDKVKEGLTIHSLETISDAETFVFTHSPRN